MRIRRIVIPILLSALSASCGDRDPIDGPSIILVSLDTTRADGLGLYGYGRETTPMLDALGKKGLVFMQAVTPSNNTLISHATILTGLNPAVHGVTYKDDGIPLHENYTTLAEDFAEAGYQTAGFTTHEDWLNERFGFHQGFDTFSSEYRSADEVLKEAEDWLSGIDPYRPCFLFIHLFDVHSDWEIRPYDAPEPFLGRFTSGYDGPLEPWEKQTRKATRFLRAVFDGSIEITSQDVDYLRGQYDEGLAYADNRLGRFLNSLESLGDTYIIIAADHGEEFKEHGKVLHSSHYDEIIRIPFIILPPPAERARLGAPRFIANQVTTLDMRPTLLSLAGLPEPADCQGVDLTPWLAGKRPYTMNPLVFERHSGTRVGGYKLIRKAGGHELYHVALDPGEKENLIDRPEMKKVVTKMQKLILHQKEKDKGIREKIMKSARHERIGRDEEMDERLRKLGYTR